MPSRAPKSRLPELPATPGRVPSALHAGMDELDSDSGLGRWAPAAERSASRVLRWRADPAPALKQLQKATKAGAKAGRKALPVGARWEIAADVKPGRRAGVADVVVRMKVRGPGVTARSLAAPAEAFARSFEAALPAAAKVTRVEA